MPEEAFNSRSDFQVSEFKRNGHLLSSRYSFDIRRVGTHVLTAVGNRIGLLSEFTRSLNYRAINVTLPNVSLASAPAKIFGTDYEIPYQRNFDGTIDLTIIADKNNAIRNVFEDIIALIQNPRTGQWSFRDDYVFDLRVDHLSRSDVTTASYFIRECYPKTITSRSLSASQNELVAFTVALSYRDFHTDFDIGGPLNPAGLDLPAPSPPPPAPPPTPPPVVPGLPTDAFSLNF